MGGPGSGRRWHYGAADCTDDYRQLDVRQLQRAGVLAPGYVCMWNWYRGDEARASIQVRAETDRLILKYRHRQGDGEWQPMEYAVRLEWTACNYGGKRPWFICPAKGCRRRVAILYSGGIFACRDCLGLAYRCQREAADHRAIRQADKIRERLGWIPGIAHPPGGKPKRMRWQTYLKLLTQYHALVSAANAGMMQRFRLLEDKVNRLLPPEDG